MEFPLSAITFAARMAFLLIPFLSIYTPRPLTYGVGMLRPFHYYFLALASILFSSACAVVPTSVRVPTIVRAPDGESADHTFINPRQTTRDEVVRRLGWAEVGLNDDHLFWGRWQSSNKRRALVLIGPGVMGAEAKNLGRVREVQNVLVEFDDNGVVVSAREVKEKKLICELISWTQRPGRTFPNSSLLAHNSFIAGSNEDKAGYSQRRGKMSVRQGGLEFSDQDTQTTFQVARDRIASIELNPLPRFELTYVNKLPPNFQLKLKDKTAWGTKVRGYIDPSFLLSVLKAVYSENP